MKLSLKQLSIGATAAGVVLLFFLLHYIGVLKPVENIMVRGLRPIQSQLYSWSHQIGSWWRDYQDIQALRDQVSTVEQELVSLQLDRTQLETLREENQFLRQQLSVVDKGIGNPIVCKVIGRSTDEASNTLTLNQGKKAGFRVGYPVLVAEGVFIGKIMAVHDYTSVVLLVNDHTSQVAAAVMNGDRTIGVIRGEYGLGLKMELIPQTEQLAEQDPVVTSGIEEYIPRGLLIGTVDSIESSMEELFKNAVIRMPVDTADVSFVSVLIPPQP